MEQARPVTYPGIQKDRYIITETGITGGNTLSDIYQ